MEPEESMACPVCGGELHPHIICPFCGTDITLRSLEGLEPTYKCPVCGKEAQTKFICNECGSEFKYQLILQKMAETEKVVEEEKKPTPKKSAMETEKLVELGGGLTNGVSAKKGTKKGLTNGLTNGLGKGEKGLTNGLKGGMVNGAGVTNGTKPPKEPRKKPEHSKALPAIAAVIAILLIFSALYFMFFPIKSGIKIDGNFSDWDRSVMRDEFRSAVNPLDMVRYGSEVSDGFLYIYLQGRDDLFQPSGSRIYAFVDTDNNAATGYRINGIGADYLCKVYGSGGKITAHSVMRYGRSDGFKWDWRPYGGLLVAYKDNKMEMGFSPNSISDDYKIAFYTSDSQGHYEVSSLNIGEGPSLYFQTKRYASAAEIYPMDGSEVRLMDLGFFATGGNLTIRSLILTQIGFTEISLKDSSGNTVATLNNGRLTINRAIGSGDRLNYQIWGTLPTSGVNGSLLSVSITQVLVSPVNTILTQKKEDFRAYLGEPGGIQIDGAFGDWRNVRDDPQDNDLPSHVDVRGYSSAEGFGDLYFYLGVQGDIMAGVMVPEKYAEGVPTQNVTGIPKTETGEDVLRIHMNTDNGRYYLEVLGKEGKIISTTLYHWDGYSWREISTTSSDIELAKDSTRIEGGIPLNLIGNPGTIRIWFEMSDWTHKGDTTEFMELQQQTESRASRSAEVQVPKALTPHDPIRINGDDDFANQAASEGWKGTGTQADPYVIENYDIDAHGGGNAIYIGNTRAYFVIRNCSLYNASYQSSPYYEGAGVTLYNVQNGTITNNTASNTHNGIYLDSSSNNTISNNNVSNNYYGIYLYLSSNNTIINNTANSNSHYGIYLSSSSNNNITNNTANSNSWQGIYLLSSSYNTLTNNNLSNNGDCGILIISSDHNSITNNSILNNSYGIYLGHYRASNNTEISNNTVSNNTYGIYLDTSSSNNNITYNEIDYNTNYGVYITTSSTGNYILYNNFIGNNGASTKNTGGNTVKGTTDGISQAYDDVGTNYWYVGTKGNYWSNWDGNDEGTPNAYPIDGGVSAADYYPLPSPVPEFPEIIIPALFTMGIALLIVRRRKI